MASEAETTVDLLVPGSAKGTYYKIMEDLKLEIEELEKDNYKELKLHEELAAERRKLIREIYNVNIRSARYTEMTLTDTLVRKNKNLNMIQTKLSAMCGNASGSRTDANDAGKFPSKKDANATAGTSILEKISALQEKCERVDDLIQQASTGQIFIEALEMLEEEEKRRDAEDEKDSDEDDETECGGKDDKVTCRYNYQPKTKKVTVGKIYALQGIYRNIYKLDDPCPAFQVEETIEKILKKYAEGEETR